MPEDNNIKKLMGIISNGDLFKKLREGRPEALNYSYNIYYKKMHLFARSYINDVNIAEDIVQDAFLSLWEKRESLLPNTHVGAYLLTIVKNKALNFIKHEQVRLAAEQNLQSIKLKDFSLHIQTLEACNPEYIFSSEVEKMVHEAINELPEQSRRVFIMSRFEEKSNSEIAQTLGISVKGVEFHITKSLKKLRVKLADYTVFLMFIA